MADEEKVTTVPIPPVVVTVVGAPAIPSGTVVVTPDHQPNLLVTVISPAVAILIRFLNTFLTVLVGILTGAMATDVIQATDFWHLLIKCAGLSIAGASMGLFKDLITVFGKLEGKYPLITGNV